MPKNQYLHGSIRAIVRVLKSVMREEAEQDGYLLVL